MATKVEKAKEEPKVQLVKMVRDGKYADVHPAEVENYKLGNWAVVE
jgi:hypothetical protein